VSRTPEYVEGTEAWTRFQSTMRKVLAVPHAELQRRIEVEREISKEKVIRPGPKPKAKQSKGRASHGPAV